MTLDEAIKHCEEVAGEHERRLKVYENLDEDRPLFKEEENACKKCAEEHRQLATWLEELKALKEQPSGDCIRRADANLTDFEILMCDGDYKEALKMLLDKIKKAPSVNPQLKTEGARGDIPLQQTIPKMPQQKTGHWIHDGGYWKNRWICSECGYKLFDVQSKFCPDCGTKMEVNE